MFEEYLQRNRREYRATSISWASTEKLVFYFFNIPKKQNHLKIKDYPFYLGCTILQKLGKIQTVRNIENREYYESII
tara:strand:+ start:72 stop:302 length:231 start_codon:yes stop_codon:yes gene_type:complete